MGQGNPSSIHIHVASLYLISGAEGTLPGFVDYMYKHIVPACFLAPLKITFDLNDGHSFLVCFMSVKCLVRNC